MIDDPDIDGLKPLEDILTKRCEVPAPAPAPSTWHGVPDPTPERAPLVKLRVRHHMAARLMADGLGANEAGIGSGYSPDYIRRHLMVDPAFRELVEFYQSQKAALFTECYMRIGILGMTGVERLQERLEDDAIAGVRGDMSTKTLADVTMAALERSVAPTRNDVRLARDASGSNSIVMNLNFAEPPRTTLDLAADPVSHAQKATDSRTPNEGHPDAETRRSHEPDTSLARDTRERTRELPDDTG